METIKNTLTLLKPRINAIENDDMKTILMDNWENYYVKLDDDETDEECLYGWVMELKEGLNYIDLLKSQRMRKYKPAKAKVEHFIECSDGKVKVNKRQYKKVENNKFVDFDDIKTWTTAKFKSKFLTINKMDIPYDKPKPCIWFDKDATDGNGKGWWLGDLYRGNYRPSWKEVKKYRTGKCVVVCEKPNKYHNTHKARCPCGEGVREFIKKQNAKGLTHKSQQESKASK